MRLLLSRQGMRLAYSGRGALFQLLRRAAGGTKTKVMIPAFHCPTVVDPVLAAGLKPVFYSIRPDLTIDPDDVSSRLDSDVLALLAINYFGFPANIEQITAPCAGVGAAIIEDCAHSFIDFDPIELAGGRGDIAIYSFKKLVPSLVGGAVRVNTNFMHLPERAAAAPLRDTLVNCKRLLEQAIEALPEGAILKRGFQSFEQARVRRKRIQLGLDEPGDERILQFDYPFDPRLAASRMPWYAERILRSADITAIAERRRRNYADLVQVLARQDRLVPVYDKLHARVVPWALAVRVRDRSSVDFRLRNKGVPVFTFGETLHQAFLDPADRKSEMFEVARHLSQSLLCIPVHKAVENEALQHLDGDSLYAAS